MPFDCSGSFMIAKLTFNARGLCMEITWSFKPFKSVSVKGTKLYIPCKAGEEVINSLRSSRRYYNCSIEQLTPGLFVLWNTGPYIDFNTFAENRGSRLSNPFMWRLQQDAA